MAGIVRADKKFIEREASVSPIANVRVGFTSNPLWSQSESSRVRTQALRREHEQNQQDTPHVFPSRFTTTNPTQNAFNQQQNTNTNTNQTAKRSFVILLLTRKDAKTTTGRDTSSPTATTWHAHPHPLAANASTNEEPSGEPSIGTMPDRARADSTYVTDTIRRV